MKGSAESGPPRREGRRAPPSLTVVLAVFVAVAALAALNTGNNALYLLVSLLLGSWAAARLVARHTLRHLAVTVRVVADVFAGSPATVVLSISNASRWLPANGLICTLVGLPGRVFVPNVAAGQEERVAVTTMFPRRGRHGLPTVRVELLLPLPLEPKGRVFPQGGTVVVLPRQVAAGAVRVATLGERGADAASGRGLRGVEPDHLREFRSGDDRRDIHWKQTARQQRLVVVERQHAPPHASYVALDRQVPRLEDAVWLERFEDLVAEAAAAVRARARAGMPVGLLVGSRAMAPGRGSAHLRRLLHALALVQPVAAGEDPLPAVVDRADVYRLVGAR